MVKIGYQASHEQFSPGQLLRLVKLAEDCGFEMVLSSDHLSPWSEKQGQSGFAWSWLGAAMQETNIPFGVVTVPGYRYHPAILAQAAATLDEMFPGRFILTMGSGEYFNEKMIGKNWPNKNKRNHILKESSEIIKDLWKGRVVDYAKNIDLEKARLYTMPSSKNMKIYGAALTEETARWLGSWADGLITVSRPIKDLKKIIDAFQEKGGGKPMILKAQLSYSRSFGSALNQATEQWKSVLLPSKVLSEIESIEKLEKEGEKVSIEDLKSQIKISNNPEEFIEWIKELEVLGFESIILHNVNLEQENFIKDFGEKVLPFIKK